MKTATIRKERLVVQTTELPYSTSMALVQFFRKLVPKAILLVTTLALINPEWVGKEFIISLWLLLIGIELTVRCNIRYEAKVVYGEGVTEETKIDLERAKTV